MVLVGSAWWTGVLSELGIVAFQIELISFSIALQRESSGNRKRGIISHSSHGVCMRVRNSKRVDIQFEQC